jgi:UDP-N-acetylmuramate dehydrogenase
MIKIDEHVRLKPYNTFGIDATARYFCQITNEDQFKSLLQTDLYRNEKVLILGGGSNILFTRDFDGLVIKTDIKGIHIVHESDGIVNIKAMSGEMWHKLVIHCVNHQWGGIQNLSLIPGTVGAAPIQNIGAYGVEVKEVVKEEVPVLENTPEAKEVIEVKEKEQKKEEKQRKHRLWFSIRQRRMKNQPPAEKQ